MANSYNNWRVRLAMVGKRSRDVLDKLAEDGDRISDARFSNYLLKIRTPPADLAHKIERIIFNWENEQ